MSQQLGLGFDAPEAPRTAALRHHHVRAHETVEEAQAGEHRAQRQEDVVLEWFRAQPAGSRHAPTDVWAALERRLRWPLTSARRAITNLTTAGLLVHHEADKRPGLYGSSQGTWSLP